MAPSGAYLPSNVDAYLDQLLTRRQLLDERAVRLVCGKVKELLARESNVKHIQAPVTVVGDVHGYAVWMAMKWTASWRVMLPLSYAVS